MTQEERAAIVRSTVRMFTTSFPQGPIDKNMAFSIAADVTSSLLATVAESTGTDMAVATDWFLKAVERRASDFNNPEVNIALTVETEQ